MDLEKIKKLQAQAAANKGGGKGYRKPVRTAATSSGADDKKLSLALKKLAVQPIQGIEEVNMFQENGKVLNFSGPKVHAAVNSNTYAVYGHGQEKDLTELVPNILSQLGPESMDSLKRLAEQVGSQGRSAQKEQEPDDDDVPDLVESFDDVAEGENAAPASSGQSKLEELE